MPERSHAWCGTPSCVHGSVCGEPACPGEGLRRTPAASPSGNGHPKPPGPAATAPQGVPNLLELARMADVDPKTLITFFSDKPMKGRVKSRIEAALKIMGRADLVKPEPPPTPPNGT